MPSANHLLVKDKVQRFAKQFFDVIQIDDDGDLRIPFESTHVVISVIELDNSDPDTKSFRDVNEISTTVVNLFAFVLSDVNVSNDLYKWIATEGQEYNFGSFRILHLPDNPKKCEIHFYYRIAGDSLDPGELKNALASVAFTANGEDENLQKRFGGKRAVDL